jgi:hypothetical protein
VQIQFIAPFVLFLLLFNSIAFLPIQSSKKARQLPRASELGAKKNEPSKMVRRLQYTTALTTLFSYGLLFAFGQLRDFFRNLLDCLKRNNNDNVKVVVGRTRRQRSRPCRSFGCSLFSEVVGR